jgi:hypothetical protein
VASKNDCQRSTVGRRVGHREIKKTAEITPFLSLKHQIRCPEIQYGFGLAQDGLDGTTSFKSNSSGARKFSFTLQAMKRSKQPCIRQ